MKSEQIPFGAQYYRAPTPRREDFREDLRRFAEHGFNTIKIWLQWRWNHPAQDEFDFSDVLELLDIAKENDIGVVINIICDVMPAWFARSYPESFMETADGRKLSPQATAYRQIGGAPGPCYHNAEGIEARRRFIRAAAEALGKHTALVCWDLWNEPELTCGILRQPIQADMVCYCAQSVQAFTVWLQKKYGTLETLNREWGRRYRAWEEVEPPRSGATFQDMLDWRNFFAETLADECAMRAQAVKEADTEHPVMVHTVPAPHFNHVNACSEETLLARHCDWFGNSLGSSAFSATTATCAARGKRVWNAEIHALGGSTYHRPSVPTFEDMKRHIFIPLSRGVTGFLFWQYRPERMGLESPAWGLTDLAGGETPWLLQAKRINDALQKHAPKLLRAQPKPARMAILNSGEGEVFTWCIAGDTGLHYASVNGLFRIVYELNYAVDLISEHQLTREELQRYDCVLAPFPYYIRREHAEALREWVEAGGTLISEALYASYGEGENLHTVHAPGHGFAAVFGAEEDNVLTASHFQNAYGDEWSAQNENSLSISFQYAQGESARGYYIRQALRATSGKEIARFDDGTAAVVNAYGKGRGIWIGSLLGLQAEKMGDPSCKRFLRWLLESYTTMKPDVRCEGRVDVLYDGEQPLFVVAQAPGGALEADALGNGTLRNVMTEEEIPVWEGKAWLGVPSGGIELYRYRARSS